MNGLRINKTFSYMTSILSISLGIANIGQAQGVAGEAGEEIRGQGEFLIECGMAPSGMGGSFQSVMDSAVVNTRSKDIIAIVDCEVTDFFGGGSTNDYKTKVVRLKPKGASGEIATLELISEQIQNSPTNLSLGSDGTIIDLVPEGQIDALFTRAGGIYRVSNPFTPAITVLGPRADLVPEPSGNATLVAYQSFGTSSPHFGAIRVARLAAGASTLTTLIDVAFGKLKGLTVTQAGEIVVAYEANLEPNVTHIKSFTLSTNGAYQLASSTTIQSDGFSPISLGTQGSNLVALSSSPLDHLLITRRNQDGTWTTIDTGISDGPAGAIHYDRDSKRFVAALRNSSRIAFKGSNINVNASLVHEMGSFNNKGRAVGAQLLANQDNTVDVRIIQTNALGSALLYQN
jgi:hypothetical protein